MILLRKVSDNQVAFTAKEECVPAQTSMSRQGIWKSIESIASSPPFTFSFLSLYFLHCFSLSQFISW